jgi:hypothetical protein
MDYTIWFAGLFVLGLAVLGLMFLFLLACDKV